MRFILLISGLLSLESTQGQTIDSIACKKVEDTLKIIEKVIKDVNSDPQYKRVAAISFLCDLTKIPYERGVTVMGTEFPKESYFIKCRDWYLANKERLKWDPKGNKIFLENE